MGRAKLKGEAMTALTSLAAATVVLKSSTRQHYDFYKEWQEAVRLAAEEHSLRAVASVAGVSHARVAQIVKEDRP